jgi:hypothetical protein
MDEYMDFNLRKFQTHHCAEMTTGEGGGESKEEV